MHCEPLDAGDRYHQRLANIVEEMRIATGSPRVECVTVKTLGLNAFAFSDLHGGGVVGVTEGALARLSRQQLQGVVAHEFAHVLSGTYVTVTVSCLLFGIYSALGDSLEQTVVGAAGTRAAPVGDRSGRRARAGSGSCSRRRPCMSAALSRARERQADMAAALYTRDPLSLAEALRIIGRHPGGVGYIPEGLAPLCIRDTVGGRLARLDEHAPAAGRAGATRCWRWPRPHRSSSRGRSTPPPSGSRRASTGRRRRRPEAPAATSASPMPERRRPRPRPARTRAVRRPAGARGALAAARRARLAGSDAWRARLGSCVTGAVVPATGRTARLARRGRSRAPSPAIVRAASCPSCAAALALADYEGLRVTVCPCVRRAPRVARRGGQAPGSPRGGVHPGPGEARRPARRQRRRAASDRRARARPGRRWLCFPVPGAARPMVRRHYDYEHAVEVDYCSICDLYWFERDELEALQILAERQIG